MRKKAKNALKRTIVVMLSVLMLIPFSMTSVFAADNNAPVIEKNHTSVTFNPTTKKLNVQISAYDSDSGIREIQFDAWNKESLYSSNMLSAYYYAQPNPDNGMTSDFVKQNNSNLYTTEIDCSNIFDGSYRYQINVWDNDGNFTSIGSYSYNEDGSINTEYSDLTCTFEVTNFKAHSNMSLESVSFSPVNPTITTVDGTAEVVTKVVASSSAGFDEGSSCFVDITNNNEDVQICCNYDSTEETFIGTFDFSKLETPGEWTIKAVSVTDSIGDGRYYTSENGGLDGITSKITLTNSAWVTPVKPIVTYIAALDANGNAVNKPVNEWRDAKLYFTTGTSSGATKLALKCNVGNCTIDSVKMYIQPFAEVNGSSLMSQEIELIYDSSSERWIGVLPTESGAYEIGNVDIWYTTPNGRQDCCNVVTYSGEGVQMFKDIEGTALTEKTVSVNVQYLNKDSSGKITTVYSSANGPGTQTPQYGGKMTVDINATLQDVLDELETQGKLPSQANISSEANFVGWKFFRYEIANSSSVNPTSQKVYIDNPSNVKVKDLTDTFNLTLTAAFDKEIVNMTRWEYINGESSKSDVVFTNTGTNSSQLLSTLPSGLSKSGMTFKNWQLAKESETITGHKTVDAALYVPVGAVYNEGLPVVVNAYDKQGKGASLDNSYTLVVKEGTSINDVIKQLKAPVTASIISAGFTGWTVKYYPLSPGGYGGPGTYDSTTKITGWGARLSVYANVGGSSNSTTPSTPTTPVETPAVVLDNSKVDEAINEVAAIVNDAAVNAALDAVKQTVVVDMTNADGSVATVAPVEVLETIRGKNIDVVLDMGGYSWTINGKDINATDLEAINLEVKLDSDAVPSDVVKDLADGKPTKQISLTHDGNFGFKATLSLNLGAEYKGQYGNLYWYDSLGRTHFMDSGYIDENGNANLSFSHASDYVIVIGEEVKAGVDTGDHSNLTMYVVIGIAAAAGLGIATLKKKKNLNSKYLN